jgi:hypothetical protein
MGELQIIPLSSDMGVWNLKTGKYLGSKLGLKARGGQKF